MWQRLLCCLGSIILLTNCSTEKIIRQPILCGILTFESRAGMKAGEAETVTEMFSAALQNTGRFTVIERKQLNAVLHEQEFQSAQSGESVAKAGKILAIRKMFSGSIGMLGDNYVLNLKMIDVESSEVSLARSWTYDDDIEDIGEEFLPKVIQEIIQTLDGTQMK